PLSLLPRAKTFSTEKYRHGAAACERPFQRLWPWLTCFEVPPVDKDADAALVQRARNPFYRRVVAAVVAEENIERIVHPSAHKCSSKLVYLVFGRHAVADRKRINETGLHSLVDVDDLRSAQQERAPL